MHMRPPIAAPVAAFGFLAIALFSASFAHSQINGAPASVTSPGFGGRPINGTPASVTSLGPRGYSPAPRATFTTVPGGMHHGNGTPQGDGHHHHRQDGQFVAPLYYGYPVVYPVEVPVEDQADSVPAYDPEYQGGPTIFDRRGFGADSYIPPVKSAPAPHVPERAEESTPAPDPPDPPLPPTILVFKDGHKLEVGNYAIVGTTLFDLTPGHSRRVPVADLNLDETRKENDDRGIVFQLPQTLQGS